LASHVIDKLDAVVGSVGLKIRRGSPGERATVGDSLRDGSTNRDDIGGRAAEEENGDGVRSARLPLDGVGLAGRDNLAQRRGDGVARWVTDGGVNSSGEAGEEGDSRESVHVACIE